VTSLSTIFDLLLKALGIETVEPLALAVPLRVELHETVALPDATLMHETVTVMPVAVKGAMIAVEALK
jgi:hypothetical protein